MPPELKTAIIVAIVGVIALFIFWWIIISFQKLSKDLNKKNKKK